MESILDVIYSKNRSQRLVTLDKFCFLWTPIPNELFPSDDRRVKLDIFLPFLFSRYGVYFVHKKQDQRLRGHHMLLDVWIERGVTVLVEEIQDLLFS